MKKNCNQIGFLPLPLEGQGHFKHTKYPQLIIIYTLSTSSIIINPVLIWFYPLKRGWQDLPNSACNLSHSHSPSHSILCILLLQTNTLTLLHLRSPCLPQSYLLPLSLHFKIQCLPQNMAIIPP